MTDHSRSSQSVGTPSVTWIPPGGDLAAYSARSSAARQPERVTGWIVLTLLVASTALSLFDLYLLASGFG